MSSRRSKRERSRKPVKPRRQAALHWLDRHEQERDQLHEALRQKLDANAANDLGPSSRRGIRGT